MKERAITLASPELKRRARSGPSASTSRKKVRRHGSARRRKGERLFRGDARRRQVFFGWQRALKLAPIEQDVAGQILVF